MADIASSPLTNPDIAPTRPEARNWKWWNIAALWVGMAVCIPTYNLAGGLIDQGMNWSQALFTILLGNLIVLIPMILNAVPGTRYGIPFPVLARASFGTLGSNVPAILRALVACGWFGIQTWIGGSALYEMVRVVWGGITQMGDMPAFIGINIGQFICFAIFWSWNVYHIMKGMNSIKWLENLAAPFLILIGFGFLIWAYRASGGWGPMLSQPSRFETTGEFLRIFFPALTAMVGFWATLSLNIPDFSRYARSQRDQIIGQTVGLPTTMVLYSFIGIAVTSATMLLFSKAIWDPVTLLRELHIRGIAAPWIVLLSGFTMAVATISTNIAANVVSPANDFSNVSPRWISFRTGALITAFIGVVMMPWKIITTTQGYIFTWLIGYGTLLGPIAGIMIADFYVVRRTRLNAAALYQEKGEYTYQKGFNWLAIAVFLAGVLPNVPGFLRTATMSAEQIASAPVFWDDIYKFGWFVGFTISFALYSVVMSALKRPASRPLPELAGYTESYTEEY